ncbi:APC family permease (plasmid) [Nocardioides sp. R1-1]|uniref:APC family permease n=1 Tax=Nocardioides sp. R1-1 TaxID=3383502 RepID=UPI0038D0928A
MTTDETDPMISAKTKADETLENDAIGLSEVLFQSVSSTSPALSAAASISIGAAYAGGALPLSVLLAICGCLLVAVCVAQMARRFPSAGGFYTYTARAFHPAVGALVAWAYLLVWISYPPLLYLAFGHFLGTTIHAETGLPFEPTWVICSIICAAAVFAAGYVGVKFSTRSGVVLGIVEILIFAVLAVWLIIKAGDANTLSVFSTQHANVDGFVGTAGVVGGLVYAVFGFVGFENAAPLAEETRDPRRNVVRAMIWSIVIIGIFYVLTTYASAVYFGADGYDGFMGANGGDPWSGMAEDAWGIGWILVLFAVLNSCIASAIGGQNGGTRHVYAMARIRLLPDVLAKTHPVHRTPHVATVVLGVIYVVITIGGGLLAVSPLEAFAVIGTYFTAMIVFLYMLVAVGSAVYVLRHRREEFSVLINGVVPLGACLTMIPVFLTSLGLGSGVFAFISPLPAPLDLAAPIALVWLAVGVTYLAYVWKTDPQRIRDTENVFIE